MKQIQGLEFEAASKTAAAGVLPADSAVPKRNALPHGFSKDTERPSERDIYVFSKIHCQPTGVRACA